MTTIKPPMTILIEQSRKHNGVDKLERFGDVMYLFAEEERRPPIFDVATYSRVIKTRLEELGYNPAYDFLVMSGSSNANYVMLSTLVAAFGTVKVLMWHSATENYAERQIGKEPSEPARN